MGMIAEVNRAVTGLAGAGGGQYLTFLLGSDAYAVGIQRIREIIEYSELTTVPMMPSFIRGVINLRGHVVPVVDLPARFARGPAVVGRRTCIVIIEVAADGDTAAQDIGIVVDAVNEVVDISNDQIEPPPSFGNRIRHDFISGMARHGNRFMVILDIGRVLSMSEMAAIGQSLVEQTTGVPAATQPQP